MFQYNFIQKKKLHLIFCWIFFNSHWGKKQNHATIWQLFFKTRCEWAELHCYPDGQGNYANIMYSITNPVCWRFRNVLTSKSHQICFFRKHLPGDFFNFLVILTQTFLFVLRYVTIMSTIFFHLIRADEQTNIFS